MSLSSQWICQSYLIYIVCLLKIFIFGTRIATFTHNIQYCRFIIFLSFGMCRLTFTRTCSRQRSTYKQYVSLKRLLTTFNETFHLVRFFVRLISFSFKSITKNKTFYSPSCIRSRTLNHSKKDLINFWYCQAQLILSIICHFTAECVWKLPSNFRPKINKPIHKWNTFSEWFYNLLYFSFNLIKCSINFVFSSCFIYFIEYRVNDTVFF